MKYVPVFVCFGTTDIQPHIDRHYGQPQLSVEKAHASSMINLESMMLPAAYHDQGYVADKAA